MKNNIAAQLIFRSAYLILALVTLFVSMGIWNIGSGQFGQNFNPLFVNDFFNWAIVMSICATIFALIDNVREFAAGKTHAYAVRFPLLRFCTASSMVFCFLLGTFFIGRVGNNALTADAATNFGLIVPGFLQSNFWLDMSALFPRFIVPIAYVTGFVLFDERMKTRGIYSTLGILPPTIFYFFSFFLSLIISGVHGGAGNLPADLYGLVYPYFYCDSFYTYSGWWWILIWPTIFGVSLMLINNAVFYVSRTVKNENGKLKLYKKIKVEEETMHDCIHYFKMKRAAKRNQNGENN